MHTACSLLFHSLNDFRLRQDSRFPQDFSFFIFMFLIHGKTPDMIHACALVPSRFSSFLMSMLCADKGGCSSDRVKFPCCFPCCCPAHATVNAFWLVVGFTIEESLFTMAS